MISTCQSTTHVDKLLGKILTFDSTQFLWTPMRIVSLICWKIPQQTRWWAGSVNMQVRR